MTFSFATAGRIVFGRGVARGAGDIAAGLGRRAFVVTGSDPVRAAWLSEDLARGGLDPHVFSVPSEPSVALVERGVAELRDARSDLVVALGGGSVIDAGKAIAALAANEGEPLEYLEVIGRGRPLEAPPLPFVALPTTAGTGAEVTKNAVLASPEQRVKVSLRSEAMLPRAAIVDPELTLSVPPAVTAATGMDALTQVLEPFVSRFATPFTDLFCREGLVRAAWSLPRAYADGSDLEAREAMAFTSLLGGLALANARLGAVHGFAGVIGGMVGAPHGAICAALLAPVMAANLRALEERAPSHPALGRFAEIARLLTGDPAADAAAGVAWVSSLARDLGIPSLSAQGLRAADIGVVVEKSSRSSSMKGNPIELGGEELARALEAAL